MIKALLRLNPAASDPPELHRGLLAHYVRNHSDTWGVPVACALIGLLIAQWEPLWEVGLWLICSWVSSIALIVICKRFGDGTAVEPAQLRRWVIAIAVPRFLFILSWSSLAFWAWTPEQPQTFFVIMSILVSTMAMNASQSGSFLPFYYMEMLPKLLAVLLVSLPSGNMFQVTIAALALIGAAFFTKIAYAINLSTRTLLRQQYELAHAKEEVEQASRAKSSFLATMSHEVRTPLNGVLGIINLLKDTPLTAEQAEYVETVRYSGETLLTMLNDILDFSKMEAGKFDLEDVSFETGRLVESVVNLMWSRAAEKGLMLEAEVEGNMPPFITTDPTRLRQILLNLVGNAIKFTDKGRVSIILRAVGDGAGGDFTDFPAPGQSLWLHFDVVDTGIGISEEARAKLFREFSQVDSSIARRYGGTGLGLSICQRIVALMGGRMGVESWPGQGSVFWFEIPARVASSDASITGYEDTGDIPHLTPLNILLAEDNRVNQKVTAGLLEKFGHGVTIAEDGAEALEAVQKSAYDVILMDMQMPVVDGLQATRNIIALGGRYANIPIIALTANALRGDDARCFAAGMVDYVSKPVRPVELFRALARQLPDKVIDAGLPGPAMAGAGGGNIRELEKALGPSFIANFMKDYLPELENLYRRIETAYDQGDEKELLHAAHDLKSLSALFGLGQMSALASAVEMCCLQGRWQDSGPQVGKLQARFADDLEALRQARGL